jgi:hypothetical protein
MYLKGLPGISHVDTGNNHEIIRQESHQTDLYSKYIPPKTSQPLTQMNMLEGRAIAQAVSRWLPTAPAQVRAPVWSSGICGGHSGAGAGFLRVLRFPLPIFIPRNSPSS